MKMYTHMEMLYPDIFFGFKEFWNLHLDLITIANYIVTVSDLRKTQILLITTSGQYWLLDFATWEILITQMWGIWLAMVKVSGT